MTDDKSENIPAENDDAPQPEAVVTRDPDVGPEAADAAAEDEQLDELMASPSEAPAAEAPDAVTPAVTPAATPAGDEPVVEAAPTTAPAPKVDLEQQAIEAAAAAVAEGERAIAAAEAALADAEPPAEAPAPPLPRTNRNHRELVLRVLLAVNVVAMIVVAMLPAPAAGPAAVAAPATTEAPAPTSPTPVAPSQPTPTTPSMNEPWNQALRASERREWGAAVTILEGYLDSRPEMPPSERLSVLSALSFYASRDKDFARSRRYSQQAQALEQSHSLPADLVKEAAAAVELGDQESLRRIWARFLLQQRQIPSWLYQHVAQAYLELGNSYREDAAAGARAARARALQEAAERVRAEALEREEKR